MTRRSSICKMISLRTPTMSMMMLIARRRGGDLLAALQSMLNWLQIQRPTHKKQISMHQNPGARNQYRQ